MRMKVRTFKVILVLMIMTLVTLLISNNCIGQEVRVTISDQMGNIKNSRTYYSKFVSVSLKREGNWLVLTYALRNLVSGDTLEASQRMLVVSSLYKGNTIALRCRKDDGGEVPEYITYTIDKVKKIFTLTNRHLLTYRYTGDLRISITEI